MQQRADIVVVGSVNLDRRIGVPTLPAPGATVLAHAIERFGGGKGANQAVAVARLGRATSLVGAVGDDEQGTWLRDRLVREGVGVAHLSVVPGASGLALVFVDDAGENSIVVSAGANAELGAGAVGTASEVIGAAPVVLVQCEIPVPAIAEAARLTRGLLVLNPAPAVPLPDEVWARVDVAVPNRGELAQLTGAAEDARSTEDLVRMARELPCDRVVVTLGGAGALVVDRDDAEVVPAPRVPVVDTTGAGDCFCAALADALVDGEPLVSAARRAVGAASLSVQRIGAQSSAPTRGEVDETVRRSV